MLINLFSLGLIRTVETDMLILPSLHPGNLFARPGGIVV
jgi:hypothetical protein